jgi:serine protease AprX
VISTRRSIGVSLAAVILALSQVLLAPINSQNSLHATATSEAGAIEPDANDNHIYDDLEMEMASQESTWTREVVVVLTREPTSALIEAFKSSEGDFTLTSNKRGPHSEGRPWSIVPGFSTVLAKAQIEHLAQSANVSHIESVVGVGLLLDTAKGPTGVTKALTDFGVTGDLAEDGIGNYSEDDIVACILDTGINPGHGGLGASKVIAWIDLVGDQLSPYDDHGHGTWVAGVLAGRGVNQSQLAGVAPGVALAIAKVTDSATGPIVTNTALIVDGLDWCTDNADEYNIRIISFSLGTLQSTLCASGGDAMTQAADAAWDAGIVVVGAIGNAGPGFCTASSPGYATKIISVGAMSDPRNSPCPDRLGNGRADYGWNVAEFSGRGRTFDGRMKPDILAPGVCITTPNWPGTVVNVCEGEDYCTLSGTSLSTPFVAGTVALMMHASAKFNNGAIPNNTRIKEILIETAEDWGPNNQAGEPQSYDYGAGRLRAYEAIRVAADESGTEPANPSHFHAAETLPSLPLGVYDRWLINFTNSQLDWPLAIAVITPTLIETSATGSVNMTLRPPPGSGCSQTVNTTLQRQLTLMANVTGCGAGSYVLDITRTSGSPTYWLDISYSGSTPVLSKDDEPPGIG